jgi:dTDP-4-amino-4,6-dideoxygalactose transaminase
MIPMVNLKQQYQELKSEIEPKMMQALEDAQFVLGPNVQAFEKEAAGYLGVKHAIGVANGTDALHLALVGAGIGKGDEVITTAFTFIATAEAISYTGATIKFADIDEKTFNIDVAEVEKLITPKTKAILAVHLFGQPADMVGLLALCDKHNIALIEDAAQSFGASIDGKQTGSFGLAGCFSFFPSKNLGCYGDGGLVTTNDDAMAENIRSLRNHGSRVRYYHGEIGYNSRLDELQAVILRVKLKNIDKYSQGRRRVGHGYSNALKDIVTVPFEDNIGTHVYHQYTLLSEKRAEISQALNDKEIANAIYYPVPLHRQDVYKEEFANINLPVTEKISGLCISLPVFPELEDDKVATIVDAIKQVS